MNKDDILKISRVENQNRDIADIEISKLGIRAGWIVTVCLAAMAVVLDGIFFERPAYEILFAVMAGLSVVFFCKYAKLKKRHELIVAIIYGIAAIAWFFAWMIQIMNR